MSAHMRIRDLVKSKLVGRTIDVVGFIDALLEIAGKVGEVHCALASDQALRFELGNEGPCDIELDAARGKLRMLCARLSVHCNETPGEAVSAYGGAGKIHTLCTNGKVTPLVALHFTNTPDAHEFTLTPIAVPAIVAMPS